MKYSKLFLLLIFLTFSVVGQNRFRNNFFSFQNRVKFSASLYDSGDYIRAFDEYRSLLIQTPDDTLKIAAGLALRKMKRYSEAEDYFKSLFYFSDLNDYAKAEFFKTEFISGKYSRFLLLLKNPEYNSLKFSSGLERLRNLTFLLSDNSPIEDSVRFVSIFPKNEAGKISTFYFEKKNPERKDELLAIALSAVIPGAGKIYTEDYSDGVVAFIFTGLFYGLAAHNFAIDRTWEGALFTGIGLFFHAGSVYGSATSAQIYNARKRFEYQSRVIEYARRKKYFLPDTEKLFIGRR